jgi:hypothetical protein
LETSTTERFCAVAAFCITKHIVLRALKMKKGHGIEFVATLAAVSRKDNRHIIQPTQTYI